MKGKMIKKYRSDGFLPLLRDSYRYGLKQLNKKIRKSQLVRGRRKFESFTYLRFNIQRARYNSPAKPYKHIWIDPLTINYKNNKIKPEYGLGQVKKGNWDKVNNCTKISDHFVFKGLKQRFEKGFDWEDTAYCEGAKKRINNSDGKWSDYNDIDEFVQEQCNYVDLLFKKIKNEGYRPNFAVGNEKQENDPTGRRNLEPLVVIGRNGEIYLRGGHHRFTIAQILDIEIPFNVLGRHWEWQKVRDVINSSEDLERLNPHIQSRLGHPDLEDVLD